MSYTQFAVGLRRFLNHPTKVAMSCFVVFVISIVLNGNVFRLWGLYRDQDRILAQIQETRTDITALSAQLKLARNPSFIEREARDKLDLAGEHDLVFVFPEQ